MATPQATDNTTAYSKTVPAGGKKWAQINSFGGNTVAWNQLATVFTSSLPSGITYNGDGSYTIDGTWSVAGWIKIADGVGTIAGHTYYATVNNPSEPNITISNDGHGLNINSGIDTQVETYSRVYVRFEAGTYSNVIIKPQLFDLTQMFGAGNEPSTVEAFRAMFPDDYYSYDAGSLKSSGVSRIVSKKSNAAELQAITVPAAIRALPGYGWSAGSAYNEADRAHRKYIKRVESANLGDFNWVKNTNGNFYATKPTNSINIDYTAMPNAIIPCYTYSALAYGTVSANMAFCFETTRIWMTNTTYTDAAAFKTAMSGVYLYYELATPIETDISSLLPESNLLEVESGGSVTFENTNGASYRLPVPSQVGYYDARRASLFGSVWSYPSLDLIQQKVELQPAAPKVYLVDIPGANGSKDLSEALGVGMTYNDRDITWTFALYPGEDWASKFSEVSNALNGKRVHIVLDADPAWYYDGRITVSGHKSDKLLHQITVKATCEPYKRKRTETTVSWADLDTGFKPLVCAVGNMPLIPTITVSQATTITWGSVSKTVNAGAHILPDFRMSGTQTVQAKVASGTGNISITWREGSL